MFSSVISTIAFGFILGVKHAFDADHLAAVTTMLTNQKNPLKAASIGMYWGAGHTLTLFIVGIIVLLFRITIPDSVVANIEIIVGIMLVILGIQAIRRKVTLPHEHEHVHDGTAHTHVHLADVHNHYPKFGRFGKSFVIGAVHGLAGSGALMILVLSLVKNIYEGIVYILIFGIGSVLGMTLMSLAIGIPFVSSMKKFNQAEKFLNYLTGGISIIIGSTIIYDVVQNLI
jgi:cytochrome c biogenesis protein CcdA